MSDQYRLVGLSALVRQSNELTAQVLAHLVELEERMLHLELGFSSLFAYCTEALKMSEGAAGRRVTAARVCRKFPEAFERVARGDLHLCALCALAPHLNVNDASELFEMSRGKSRRQIEELLAARFPRPDVREQIRRLPARAPVLVADPMLSEALPIPPITPNSPPEPARVTVPEGPRRAKQIEPLSADRFGVHFTADAELRDLIERARTLASHRLPDGDLASLMKLMAATFVREEEKRRFGVGAKLRKGKAIAENESNIESTEHAATKTEPNPQTGVETPPGEVDAPPRAKLTLRGKRAASKSHRSRYVSVAVRREVHHRDHGQCAFVSVDGRRCTARARLQFDHFEPFARGGRSTLRNMRLLCGAHNQLHARRCFGSRYLAAKIAEKKRDRLSSQPRSSEQR
jgi:hypothetical protein